MCSHVEFCVGDQVRLHGHEEVGEVAQIRGKRALVTFSAIQVNVSVCQLQHPSSTTPRLSASSTKPSVRVLNVSSEDFLAFDTELDLHGLRVAAALRAVDHWIDRGALLGHKHLKIIHGKGEGILRQAVRQQLQCHGQVKRVMDKHPYRGGDGVTWVELH